MGPTLQGRLRSALARAMQTGSRLEWSPMRSESMSRALRLVRWASSMLLDPPSSLGPVLPSVCSSWHSHRECASSEKTGAERRPDEYTGLSQERRTAGVQAVRERNRERSRISAEPP